jgi:hypothetical protein
MNLRAGYLLHNPSPVPTIGLALVGDLPRPLFCELPDDTMIVISGCAANWGLGGSCFNLHRCPVPDGLMYFGYCDQQAIADILLLNLKFDKRFTTGY